MSKLTADNYYSHETDWEYMSFSLYKDFKNCEAAALAKAQRRLATNLKSDSFTGWKLHPLVL